MALMLAATWSGLRLFAPASAGSRSRGGHLAGGEPRLPGAGVGWHHRGAGRLVAAALDGCRRCGLLAFATFVLDYVGRFWDAVGPLARVSPFTTLIRLDDGRRAARTSSVVILLGVFVAGAVIANIAYERRDL
jgi:hypothetical protein